MADRNQRYSNSSSDGKKSRRSAGSNEAQYKGSSRENTSSDDSKRTQISGFSNFSQTPNTGLYGSSTNQQTNPRSAENYRATEGVPQNPILYGNSAGRSSTSTYPTKPEEHRDDYRKAVAKGVPDDSEMKKLNDKYKKADHKAEETKETYKKHRSKNAATSDEVKAEKKAIKEKKYSEDERKYRGLPAGTRRFHERAIPLVESAIQWADYTEELRTEMAESYIATEPSKKSADGHRKRAKQQSQSSVKLSGYLQEHKRALSQFDQAETAAQAALAARMARMAVGDEEDSDNERQRRSESRPGRSEPRSSRSDKKPSRKGKEREERSSSRSRRG